MSNFKFLVLTASAVILLSACDSGSSSDPVSDPISEADMSAPSLDDLAACNSEREGITAYVKDENALYLCKEGDWVADDGKSAEEKKDKGNSSSSVEPDDDGEDDDGENDKTVDPSSVVKGSFTDERDGQVYKTVQIGDQVWMAENLNYGDSVQTPNLTGATWCGGGESKTTNEGDCSIYGRLYTWAAAVNEPEDKCGYKHECNLSGPVQGICPDGWHLPDTTEFRSLWNAVGGPRVAGTMLKSTSGWYDDGNGLDAYGFSAFPAGDSYDVGYFHLVGLAANFWSSTERNSGYSYLMRLRYDFAYADKDSGTKNFGFSIRCLKNN